MTDDTKPVSEDELTAFIDGRLPEERRSAVERHLRDDAEARAQVQADLAALDSLQQRLNPIAAQPVPHRLRTGTILAARRATFFRRLRMAAACVVLLGGGTAAGWVAHDLVPGRALLQQASLAATATDAIAAHRVFVVERVHPVEVGVAQEAHLVQWLSRRVGQPLKIPDLSALGYTLMGGRVLPAGEEAAAQFMFENGSGQRLTVYVRASDGGDTAFRFVSSAGVGAFSWIDEGLGFAIVGATDRKQLLDVADAVYQQVSTRRRAAPASL